MGRKRDKKSSTLGMTVDGQGNSDFSAIVTYGKGKDTTVHTRYQDLVPKVPGQEGSLARPDEEDVEDTEAKTKAAMEKIVSGKVAASPVTNVGTGGRVEQYLRYTPAHSTAGSGASQRIVHMVEMPKAPMAVPQFKHKRVPGGPPSPTQIAPCPRPQVLAPWRERASFARSLPPGALQPIPEGYAGHATASPWPRRTGPVPGAAAT